MGGGVGAREHGEPVGRPPEGQPGGAVALAAGDAFGVDHEPGRRPVPRTCGTVEHDGGRGDEPEGHDGPERLVTPPDRHDQRPGQEKDDHRLAPERRTGPAAAS